MIKKIDNLTSIMLEHDNKEIKSICDDSDICVFGYMTILKDQYSTLKKDMLDISQNYLDDEYITAMASEKAEVFYDGLISRW